MCEDRAIKDNTHRLSFVWFIRSFVCTSLRRAVPELSLIVEIHRLRLRYLCLNAFLLPRVSVWERRESSLPSLPTKGLISHRRCVWQRRVKPHIHVYREYTLDETRSHSTAAVIGFPGVYTTYNASDARADKYGVVREIVAFRNSTEERRREKTFRSWVVIVRDRERTTQRNATRRDVTLFPSPSSSAGGAEIHGVRERQPVMPDNDDTIDDEFSWNRGRWYGAFVRCRSKRPDDLAARKGKGKEAWRVFFVTWVYKVIFFPRLLSFDSFISPHCVWIRYKIFIW